VFRPLDAPAHRPRFFRQPDARPPLFSAVDHASTASCPSVLIASYAAGEDYDPSTCGIWFLEVRYGSAVEKSSLSPQGDSSYFVNIF
jgi:hypothetical protein